MANSLWGKTPSYPITEESGEYTPKAELPSEQRTFGGAMKKKIKSRSVKPNQIKLA